MKIIERVEDFLQLKMKEMGLRFYDWVITDLKESEVNEKPISSPVEQLFYIEWYSRWFLSSDHEDLPFYLDQQYKDKSTGKYVIDFQADFLAILINTDRGLRFSDKAIRSIEQPKLGIEIDGHIWHEKTKEQVQYHKKRERFLIANGWKLLRFTGSEVYKDPAKSLDEAIKLGGKLANQWHRKLREFDKKGNS